MTYLLDLIAPGEILLKDFMRPLGVSQNRLSRDLDIPVSRAAGIVHGKRAITADTALRLSAYFGTSAELWIRLQADYELKAARKSSLLAGPYTPNNLYMITEIQSLNARFCLVY